MAFSSIVSLAIVFATAATLNVNGITDIETSAQAAEALRPIAGPFAFAMFALGIIGTGLLAVPILAGSAAYAVTEMMGKAGSLWPRARMTFVTLSRTPEKADGVEGCYLLRFNARRGARLRQRQSIVARLTACLTMPTVSRDAAPPSQQP